MRTDASILEEAAEDPTIREIFKLVPEAKDAVRHSRMLQRPALHI